MPGRHIDLNGNVVAARRLRAAAVVPQLAALCGVVVSVLILSLAANPWPAVPLLLAGVAVMIVLARFIERGARWALAVLTAMLAVTTAVAAVALLKTDGPPLERAQAAAGFVLMLTPCWVLIALGWKAIGRRDAVAAIHDVLRSAWSTVPRERRSRRAQIWFAAAVLVYAAGVVPALLAAVAVGGHLWAIAVVYAPVAAVAGRLWVRGRRLSALDVQQIRMLDVRPPVLLLRSFGDDNLPLEKRYRLLSFLFSAREALTLEAFVVNQLWRFGPVIAIGNPTERLSPLGAAREYIPEDRWRSHVNEYLAEAKQIVSVLGGSPGLMWEYEQLEARGRDEGLLIVFPPRAPDELQRRWTMFQRANARSRSTSLQWEPFIGVPLLALLAPGGPILLYCKYRHELAYAAALRGVFDLIGAAGPRLRDPRVRKPS